MRNSLKFAFVLTGLVVSLAGAVLPAAASAGGPVSTGSGSSVTSPAGFGSVPECVFTGDPAGGRFARTLTCVQLVQDRRTGDAAAGRLVPGDSGNHSLTVSLQALLVSHGRFQWVTLAEANTKGPGELDTMTHSVRVSVFDELRACSVVDGGPRALCTPLD